MPVNRITDRTKIYQAAQAKDLANGDLGTDEFGAKMEGVGSGRNTQGILQSFVNEEAFFGGKNFNPLHNYNSYNYIFTLSSLSTKQFKDPESYSSISKGKESPDFYTVLRSGGYERSPGINSFMQSGSIMPGADTAAEMVASNNKPLKDLPGQQLHRRDLFIENVNMNTIMGLGGAGVSNLTTGSFEVTEPHSVAGFYEELYAAAVFAGHPNYLGAPFLLSVEFIGHRYEGETLITETVKKGIRHFPILLTKSSMNVTEAGATYQVTFAGVNSKGGTAATSLLENVGSPKQAQPTVHSVLSHLFLNYNEHLEKQMKEYAKGKEQSDEADVAVVKQAAAEVGAENVKPFQATKFTIHFPDKNHLWDLTTLKHSSWKGEASNIVESFETDNNPNDTGVALKNKISQSKMTQGDLPYSGFYAFEKYDEQVKTSDEAIKQKVKSIQDKLKDIKTAFGDAEKEALAIRDEIKVYYNVNDEELEAYTPGFDPKKVESPVPSERKENAGATYKTTPAKQIDWSIWADKAKVTVATDFDGGTPTITKDKQGEINGKIKSYNGKLRSLESLKNQQYLLERELKKLKEAKGVIYTQSYTRYGKNAPSWQFRKGSTLQENIHNIILDSEYATNLTKPEDEKAYKETGFFQWYKIDVIPEQVGYDTAINQYVYEYHFIVIPYRCHVSQLPGVQDVGYNYDKAKEEAVREYNYIYTGKNLDVMKFNLDFDNLYIAAPAMFKAPEKAPGSTSTAAENQTYQKSPQEVLNAAKENRVGNQGSSYAQSKDTPTANASRPTNRTEVAKALHDALYNNPGNSALLKAEMTIVGDPVYLLSANINKRTQLEADEIETVDGEANAFTRQCDVIFNFGTALDYPTQEEIKGGKNTMILQPSYYSGVYQVTKVQNNFSEGVFQQELTMIRRPNQANDYTQPRAVEMNISEDAVNKKTEGTTSEGDQTKTPVVKLPKTNEQKSAAAALSTSANPVAKLKETAKLPDLPAIPGAGAVTNVFTQDAATTNIADADAKTQALFAQGIVGQVTNADGTVRNIFRPGFDENGRIESVGGDDDE